MNIDIDIEKLDEEELRELIRETLLAHIKDLEAENTDLRKTRGEAHDEMHRLIMEIKGLREVAEEAFCMWEEWAYAYDGNPNKKINKFRKQIAALLKE